MALKELIAQKPIDILFLQETLGEGDSVANILKSFLPNWTFITLDAHGRSGGCALGINCRTTRMINCWGRVGVLGMDIKFGHSKQEFTLINVYEPCLNRDAFWNSLLACSLLTLPHIILGGDLNFSLGIFEYWGTHAIPNPLAEFFSSKLEAVDLINIQTTKIQPTWRNRRTGDPALARRLDRFLIK